MNLRWLLFDYSDPDLPVSYAQRMRLSFGSLRPGDLPDNVRREGNRFVLCLALICIIAALPMLLHDVLGIHVRLAGLLFIALLYLLTAFACGLLCRKQQRFLLRLKGFDVCLQCGYWLRELPDDVTRCPECGADRLPMPEASK